MSKRKINYKELYSFLKEGTSTAEVAEMFGISKTTVSFIKTVGNCLLDGESTPSVPTLAMFTPRQLMEELAARGYKGSLTYTKVIDICKL